MLGLGAIGQFAIGEAQGGLVGPSVVGVRMAATEVNGDIALFAVMTQELAAQCIVSIQESVGNTNLSVVEDEE